ncbi:MAG TPA: VOC family protein [Chloroflexota bacterium]|nr:VOC family protein [Chloroflexota bacterium]
MSTPPKAPTGTIAWLDLTVPRAAPIRDFYAAVIGWRPEPLDMGDRVDFVMRSPATGDGVAGVCNAVGELADLPAQWLAYIVVDDLDASMQRCTEHGGTVIAGPRGDSGEGEGGGGRYCVIRDPAGAVLALFQHLP